IDLLKVQQVATKELITTIQETIASVEVLSQNSEDYNVGAAAVIFMIMDVPLFTEIEQLSIGDCLDLANSGMGVYVEEYANLLPDS
ncbi:hypothetical protein MKW98_013750, partial [Papaver atlanticum]